MVYVGRGTEEVIHARLSWSIATIRGESKKTEGDNTLWIKNHIFPDTRWHTEASCNWADKTSHWWKGTMEASIHPLLALYQCLALEDCQSPCSCTWLWLSPTGFSLVFIYISIYPHESMFFCSKIFLVWIMINILSFLQVKNSLCDRALCNCHEQAAQWDAPNIQTAASSFSIHSGNQRSGERGTY